jgi:hypothetical protein
MHEIKYKFYKMASLVQNNNEHSLTSPAQKCTGEFGALAGNKSPSLPGTTNRGLWKVYVLTNPEQSSLTFRSLSFVQQILVFVHVLDVKVRQMSIGVSQCFKCFFSSTVVDGFIDDNDGSMYFNNRKS